MLCYRWQFKLLPGSKVIPFTFVATVLVFLLLLLLFLIFLFSFAPHTLITCGLYKGLLMIFNLY